MTSPPPWPSVPCPVTCCRRLGFREGPWLAQSHTAIFQGWEPLEESAPRPLPVALGYKFESQKEEGGVWAAWRQVDLLKLGFVVDKLTSLS